MNPGLADAFSQLLARLEFERDEILLKDAYGDVSMALYSAIEKVKSARKELLIELKTQNTK